MTQTEALRLAFEALHYCEALNSSVEKQKMQAITAIKAALEAKGEPDELRHIDDGDCLLDVDERAWRSLIENRGGCRCFISPPCFACSEPISEKELNEVGYTYTTPPQRKPLTYEELESLVKWYGEKDNLYFNRHEFARAIEAAHGIKDNT